MKQVIINYDDQGRVHEVTGPLGNATVFKGLLAEASRVCDEYNAARGRPQATRLPNGKDILLPGARRIIPEGGV